MGRHSTLSWRQHGCPQSNFSQRIDYVFARGLAGPNGQLPGKLTLVGGQPGDKVPGPAHPIWMSS